ncbi:right-handed parallel beta-helix repeat-containing protein, partial [bacterium]|nr:right-handed parallel beta-helix repeat-containing protein [bacterium]
IWSAATSDIHSPGQYLVYENFSGLTDPICNIHFWGLTAWHDGLDWNPCTENPIPFSIKFYTDAAGYPGTEVCSYSMTLTGVDTDSLYDTYPLYYYSATLTPCCNLSNGWVSIQGGGISSCWFLWMSGYGTDYHCYQESLYILNDRYYDQSFCLTPTEGTGNVYNSQTGLTYPTIQAAVDALGGMVTGGSQYIEIRSSDTYNEAVMITGITTSAVNTLTIRSQDGLMPIVNGGAYGSCFTIDNTSYLTIQKLTITGASVLDDDYGIWLKSELGPCNYLTIEECKIHNNGSNGIQGSYYCGNNITIRNCLIYGNGGDGIQFFPSSGTMSNLTILNNTLAGNNAAANNWGGVVLVPYDNLSDIYNITLRNNIIQVAGFSVYDACLTFGAGGLGYGAFSDMTFLQCDYNNLHWTIGYYIGWIDYNLSSYSSLALWQTATGRDLNSISTDPMFVNAAGSDFHLQSTNGSAHNSDAPWPPGTIPLSWTFDGFDSPSIDAGDPSDDYSNEPDGHGDRINQGCFGNTVQASKSSTCNPGLWVGTVSSAWSDSANWSCSIVPDNSIDVTIPNGCPHYPTTDIEAQCRNLVLETGAQLTMLNRLDVYGPTIICNTANLSGTGTLYIFNHCDLGGIQSIQCPLTITANTTTLGHDQLLGGTPPHPLNIEATATLQTNNYDVSCGSLRINGMLNASPAHSITVEGDWTNNGLFNSTTGSVYMLGNWDVTGSNLTSFFNLTIFAPGIRTLQRSIKITGDLLIVTIAELNANGQTIEIAGDWTNNGMFTPAGGIVTFDGISDQTISGSAQTVFYFLYMNKSGGKLILDQDIGVHQILDMAAPNESIMDLETTGDFKIDFRP